MISVYSVVCFNSLEKFWNIFAKLNYSVNTIYSLPTTPQQSHVMLEYIYTYTQGYVCMEVFQDCGNFLRAHPHNCWSFINYFLI